LLEAVGRLLTGAALVALAAGCGGYSPDEPWSREDGVDTDDVSDELEVDPIDDDEPGGDDDAQQRPHEPSPRACEPDYWARGWTPASSGPVLTAHMNWEAVGVRPSQFVEQDGHTEAWYVGQSLEHCVVGNWAATCLVGRVGRADKAGTQWSFLSDGPAMDLWHWGLSVRRLFVRAPEASSAGQWDAWLALEGIDVDSQIYWATSEDGERWTVRVSEPALEAGVGTWDAGGVSDPQVWTRHGVTSMLYTGFEGEFDRPQIGLAQLTDQGWVRASDEPILAHGDAGRHDAWGVLRPSVLVFEDCLVMFHQAIDDAGNSTLSVATSSDGRHWERVDQPIDAGQGILDWHDAGEYDPVAFMEGENVNLLFTGAAKAGSGGVGWLALE
jgi:hypothetical protein